MRRTVIVAALLIAAACSGDAESPTSTAQDVSTTAISSSIDAAQPGSTEPAATSPSSDPTTTTTPPPTTTIGEGEPAIRIDEIVFAGEPYLVISNKGFGPGSTGGHFICQFPAYFELPDFELQPGERLAVPLGRGTVPDLVGVVATVDVQEPIGTMSSLEGELGLYMSNTFNSSDAILDYVEWGSSGHARSLVAVDAGIWVSDGFVEVPAELLAIVAQEFPTAGPDDWFAEIGG